MNRLICRRSDAKMDSPIARRSAFGLSLSGLSNAVARLRLFRLGPQKLQHSKAVQEERKETEQGWGS